MEKDGQKPERRTDQSEHYNKDGREIIGNEPLRTLEPLQHYLPSKPIKPGGGSGGTTQPPTSSDE